MKNKKYKRNEPFSAIFCEIVTIGSELLLGQIEDTNTTYLARVMGELGVIVRFRTAVGDRMEEIVQSIRTAAKRSDFIIATGGLGPTLDDLTREAVARSAGVDLEFSQKLMDQIEDFFKKTKFSMSDNNMRQAFVPEGSLAICNQVGTAPAFIKEVSGVPVICLPGVPSELKFIMRQDIIPWLKNRFHLSGQVLTYKVIKTVGVGESMVDNLIGDLIIPGENPEVGLLASIGEIKVRISAIGGSRENARALIRPVEDEIRSRLGEKVYGEDEETLEGIIDSILRRKNLNLAIFDTFSGGRMALRLHSINSGHLIESRVIAQKKHVAQFLSMNNFTPGMVEAMALAEKIRKSVGADVGAALLGFPKHEGEIYRIKGFSAARYENLEKKFSWTMGGKLEILEERGAIIGLNTLRLILLQL